MDASKITHVPATRRDFHAAHAPEVPDGWHLPPDSPEPSRPTYEHLSPAELALFQRWVRYGCKDNLVPYTADDPAGIIKNLKQAYLEYKMAHDAWAWRQHFRREAAWRWHWADLMLSMETHQARTA